MNETCYNMVYEVMLPIGRTPHTLNRYSAFNETAKDYPFIALANPAASNGEP